MVRIDAVGVFAVLMLTLRPAAEGARILAIETIAGNSHWNFMSSVLRALTDSGRHHVTVFTPFASSSSARENYTEIDTSDDLPKKHGMDFNSTILFRDFTFIHAIPAISKQYCNIVYANVRLTEMLATKCDFDVILIEPMWIDCVSYMATLFRLPVIYLIPNPMITFLERNHLGHVPNPATVSNLIAHHATPVTFVQRFTNTVFLVYTTLLLNFVELWYHYSQPEPYDNASGSVPPSVIFSNTHFISEPSRPMPPNVIPIGGIHLAAVHTVPHDILEFIENSPHGVIYFTFGSVFKMSTIPEHIHNALKEALARVPQRVLWKYEGEMKDKPSNVMTREWFPQRDILMHPNVKLFVSHGGISGLYEAVDAAVPVLGFPLFYDQPRNIDNLVHAGMAISMDIFTVQTESFLKNILELIDNEKYTKNAQITSDRFKDRPMSPAQSVVYWTEYVIRHKGAQHLKSQAFNLTWYQYFLLDVIAVSLTLIFLAVFLLYKCVRIIYTCQSTMFHNNKMKSE